MASDFLRRLCVRAVTRRTEEALSRRFVREPDICLLVHNHTGWFQGEQLFLYNLEVIHRLGKKNKNLFQLILQECAALQGSPAKKTLCLTRSLALSSASLAVRFNLSSPLSVCPASSVSPATFCQPATNT